MACDEYNNIKAMVGDDMAAMELSRLAFVETPGQVIELDGRNGGRMAARSRSQLTIYKPTSKAPVGRNLGGR